MYPTESTFNTPHLYFRKANTKITLACTNARICILSFYCTAKCIVQISISKHWTAIEKWKCANIQNVISVFTGPRAQMKCKSSPFFKCIPSQENELPSLRKTPSRIPFLSLSIFAVWLRGLVCWLFEWSDGLMNSGTFWSLLFIMENIQFCANINL